MESRNYFGCRVIQRSDSDTTAFFVFYARAKDIKEWAGVRRVQDFSEGTQRPFRESRVKAITRFINSDSKNTIPNNVLLAFGPSGARFTSLNKEVSDCLSEVDPYNNCDGQLTWGILSFSFEQNLPEHLRPAFIVDGQHRIFGISDFQGEDLPVLAVTLLDASLEEQAFQFIVINNKAVRVPTDNVKAIIANLDEESLQSRLLKAGVRYGDTSPVLRDINDLLISPFRGLLDWPYNKVGQKLVPLTAIEQALRYIRSVFPFLDEDEDSMTEFFCSIWMSISKNYSSLWGKENKFMTKVNINALNEFVIDRLQKAWEFGLVDIFSSESVETQVVEKAIGQVPEEFWQAEWSIRIQDNANVRKMIKEDLEQIIRNERLREVWHAKLQLPAMND